MFRTRTWSSVLQDARYAVRTLRRDAGLGIFAVLILGLGIGANTAVFSIAGALVLKPLPFHEPERLAWVANTGRGGGLSSVTLRTSNLRDWRRMNRSFEDLGGYFAFFDYGGYTLTGDGEPERLAGVGVTETFLPVLGVQPRLGRGFLAEECQWNGPPAALLTHRFWQRRFGGDPAIVGRTLTLNDRPTTVVGVLPASFDFASIFSPGSRIDLLTPFPVSDETDRSGNTLAVIGRLRPGVTIEQAQGDLDLINEQLKLADPARWGLGAAVRPLQDQITGRFRRAVVVLACAVALVLLIACANLSNLLLARAASRRTEMAVRSAMGASRGRLVRQMLTESAVLAACGAGLGVLVAFAITSAVAETRAVSIPMLATVGLDGAALAFTAIVAAGTGLVFGLVPALQASGREDHDALKEASRGSTESAGRVWTRAALMVSEVALACVLVVGAGLLLRSFAALIDVDPGFRPERAAAWRIEARWEWFANLEEKVQFYERIVREVERLPGVDSVGLTDALPLGRNRSWGIRARGVVYAEGEAPGAFPRIVDDRYRRTMGIPLVAGRDFTAQDTAANERVMIVNETMARRLWPGLDPIGQVALLYGRQEWRVVGVVGDVHHSSLEQAAENEMYMPMAQQGDYSSMELAVKTSLSPEALAPAVRAALHAVDTRLPAGDFLALSDLVNRSLSPRRFVLQVLGAFALTALALAALGIYGVVSYSVSQRMPEFGIRMALGASPAEVRRRLLARTLTLTGAGVAMGAAGSLALSGLLASLLYGIEPTDPLTFFGVALLLTIVALLAAFVPAWRASRADLASVLRSA